MRGVLLLSATAAIALASIDRAAIIAVKELTAEDTQDVLVKDSKFKVTYTILNAGEGEATDVSLVDSFPEDMFTVVSGSSTVSIPSLSPGQNHTATLTLVPRVAGVMTVGRAEVSYTVEGPEGEPVEAKTLSSTPGRMEIYTRTTYDLEAADHSFSAAVAFLAGLVAVAVPYYFYREARAPLSAAAALAVAAAKKGKKAQ